jgi:hypothetical protein
MVAALMPVLASGATSDEAVWRSAELRWKHFIQVRQAVLPEARVFARFRHPLLDRRLPLYRFYADGVQVYALTRGGHVYALAQRAHSEPPPQWCRQPLCEARDASDILHAAPVSSGRAAADVIKLFVLMTSNGLVPNAGAEILGAYKPVATRPSAAEWRVDLEYAGAPGVSIIAQPTYRIITDGNDRLIELRRITELTGPQGERL